MQTRTISGISTVDGWGNTGVCLTAAPTDEERWRNDQGFVSLGGKDG